MDIGHSIQCAAAQSMDPWAMIKKGSQECGGDISSCLGPYPTATCPEFHIGCRLGWELFTLPVCCLRCPWSHGQQPKKLYHTRSVAVTPAPVRFPIQRPLAPSFTYQTTLVYKFVDWFTTSRRVPEYGKPKISLSNTHPCRYVCAENL